MKNFYRYLTRIVLSFILAYATIAQAGLMPGLMQSGLSTTLDAMRDAENSLKPVVAEAQTVRTAEVTEHLNVPSTVKVTTNAQTALHNAQVDATGDLNKKLITLNDLNAARNPTLALQTNIFNIEKELIPLQKLQEQIKAMGDPNDPANRLAVETIQKKLGISNLDQKVQQLESSLNQANDALAKFNALTSLSKSAPIMLAKAESDALSSQVYTQARMQSNDWATLNRNLRFQEAITPETFNQLNQLRTQWVNANQEIALYQQLQQLSMSSPDLNSQIEALLKQKNMVPLNQIATGIANLQNQMQQDLLTITQLQLTALTKTPEALQKINFAVIKSPEWQEVSNISDAWQKANKASASGASYSAQETLRINWITLNERLLQYQQLRTIVDPSVYPAIDSNIAALQAQITKAKTSMPTLPEEIAPAISRAVASPIGAIVSSVQQGISSSASSLLNIFKSAGASDAVAQGAIRDFESVADATQASRATTQPEAINLAQSQARTAAQEHLEKYPSLWNTIKSNVTLKNAAIAALIGIPIIGATIVGVLFGAGVIGGSTKTASASTASANPNASQALALQTQIKILQQIEQYRINYDVTNGIYPNTDPTIQQLEQQINTLNIQLQSLGYAAIPPLSTLVKLIPASTPGATPTVTPTQPSQPTSPALPVSPITIPVTPITPTAPLSPTTPTIPATPTAPSSTNVSALQSQALAWQQQQQQLITYDQNNGIDPTTDAQVLQLDTNIRAINNQLLSMGVTPLAQSLLARGR